jgi:hypothetical protein
MSKSKVQSGMRASNTERNFGLDAPGVGSSVADLWFAIEGEAGRKQFFFEKKNQKTFTLLSG